MCPVKSKEVPIARWAVRSEPVVPSFWASAKNCAAMRSTRSPLKRHKVRGHRTVEDRKQHQRFERLSGSFSFVDQNTRALRSRLGFGRGIAFDMNERGYESDLEFDLLPTPRG